MPHNHQWTEEENDLLIKELKKANHIIKAANMDLMSSLWDGFFHGIKRTPCALYQQTIKLAKEQDIFFTIDSRPKRDRSKWKQPEKKVRNNSSRLEDKIYLILHEEIRTAVVKATKRFVRYIEELSRENTELKKEIAELRPYQEIVKQKYKRELS